MGLSHFSLSCFVSHEIICFSVLRIMWLTKFFFVIIITVQEWLYGLYHCCFQSILSSLHWHGVLQFALFSCWCSHLCWCCILQLSILSASCRPFRSIMFKDVSVLATWMTSVTHLVVSHALSSSSELELTCVSPDILVIDVPDGFSAVWVEVAALMVHWVLLLEGALGAAFSALLVHCLFPGMSYSVPSGVEHGTTLHLEHPFKANSSGPSGWEIGLIGVIVVICRWEL